MGSGFEAPLGGGLGGWVGMDARRATTAEGKSGNVEGEVSQRAARGLIRRLGR